MAEEAPKSPYVTKDVVRHDGKDVKVGGTIHLTAEQAEQLLDLGVIEEAPAKKAKA